MACHTSTSLYSHYDREASSYGAPFNASAKTGPTATIYCPLICRRLFERDIIDKGAPRCVLDSTDLVGAFHAIETREEQTHRVGEVG